MAKDLLETWHRHVQEFEKQINQVVIGLERAVRLITIATFARGHVMLEGDVGVGKTTLLRAVARGIGGDYERIEGTIDLMPNDLIYHTYINQSGKPQVDPGPILKHGEKLSTFFFNEVNRARPQVHSLLLRIMAEKSVTAFNQEHLFPHLQVFADRNRVEKDETFEIPTAARDRFMMELRIETPKDPALQKNLMINPRFHDIDKLIETVQSGILPFQELNQIGEHIQQTIKHTNTLQDYAWALWQATHHPEQLGIEIDGVDIEKLILAGASPRAASMLMRAARVNAWINGRDHVFPEDIRDIFHETIGHRIYFNPTYEMRRESIAKELTQQILQHVATP
ncbi:MAG: MoxR family ATPase [Methylococcaceae bacterium]